MRRTHGDPWILAKKQDDAYERASGLGLPNMLDVAEPRGDNPTPCRARRDGSQRSRVAERVHSW